MLPEASLFVSMEKIMCLLVHLSASSSFTVGKITFLQ